MLVDGGPRAAMSLYGSRITVGHGSANRSPVPWYPPVNTTIRSRPVTCLASRAASTEASLPEFVNRVSSTAGRRAARRCASRPWAGCGAGNTVPSGSASLTAAVICGWLCP